MTLFTSPRPGVRAWIWSYLANRWEEAAPAEENRVITGWALALWNERETVAEAERERVAQVVEALPAGTWGDEGGERSPWPVAARAIRQSTRPAALAAGSEPLQFARFQHRGRRKGN